MKMFYKTINRRPLILIIITLLCYNTNISFSQSKKEIQFSLDSLQRAYNSLQKDYNKLKNEWKDYDDFYQLIKSEVLEPSEMNIGTEATYAKWQAARKSLLDKYNSLKETNSELSDSLEQLIVDTHQLAAENKIFKTVLHSSIDEATIPNTIQEFTGKWNLFLDQVHIEGKPFESGIIATNDFLVADSINSNNIYLIDFQESDLANIFFKNGKTIKCFYSVNSFSTKKPYSIYFSKQEEFKLTLLVTPMPEGLLVSFEDPDKNDTVEYFYGLMKK